MIPLTKRIKCLTQKRREKGMENFRWNLQETNRQRGCREINSGSTTGMLLGRQRCGNLGRNKLGQNRLEWRC